MRDQYILPGTKVVFSDEVFEVEDYVDLDRVVVANNAGVLSVKRISQLEALMSERSQIRPVDLEKVEPEAWNTAFEIYRHIKHLVELPKTQRTLAEVKKSAAILGKHSSTVYRWIAVYEETRRVSALLRKKRADAGVSRLAESVRAVLNECVETHYLTENRKSIASVALEVRRACTKAGLPPPNASTVRAAVQRLDPALVETKRFSKKKSLEKYEPSRGSFPNADFPMAVVQIDHTPMDVIIVDDIHRKPIGRAYLTIAIDVNTKMVPGFVISIDAPGTFATGTCIAMSILPKDDWLLERKIPEKYSWPCRGMMRTIHTDNAKEFKGEMLRLASQEYGFIAERRPKGQPQYGGGVERAFRTFMKKVHEELPGTTFSNVQDKVDYDSDGNAVMTLAALERWFTIYLLGVYHETEHKGNQGESPAYAWRKAHLEGTDGVPPLGVPPPMSVEQRERLRLDFLPCFEATVQQYGVRYWSIDWYSHRIQRFIREKGSDGKARKFICRYDPRNLSKIWLYDDRTREYIELPFRVTSRLPISLWEVKLAKRDLRKDGRPPTNEALIFEAIDYMRELVKEESQKTKSARRHQQRQREWEKAGKTTEKKPVPHSPPQPVPQEESLPDSVDLLDGIREA
jgi:putative transposase